MRIVILSAALVVSSMGFAAAKDPAQFVFSKGPVVKARNSGADSKVLIKEKVVDLRDKSKTTKRISFEDHIRSGGKWIEVNLAYNRSKKIFQHFRAYEGNRLVFSGSVSGAITNEFRPLNSHPKTPHNHLGTFWVGLRSREYRSKLYDVPMRNCLFYLNGHAIHACQSSDIKRLGRPASHGCTRVSPKNARKLFGWVDGDRVAVRIVR